MAQGVEGCVPFLFEPVYPVGAGKGGEGVGSYAISSVIGEGGERLGEDGVCGVREESKEECGCASGDR